MRAGLIAVLLLATAAGAQTPGKPAAPSMRTFTDAGLQLTFSYPAELTPVDPQAAAALGQRILYGEDGAGKQQKMKESCMQTLLAVGEDRPAMARLSLFAIDLSCLPPKTVKNRKRMDQVLFGMAAQGNEVLGMTPMGEPTGYLLQGNHAVFASAEGQPVTAGALQSDPAQVTATVVVAVEERGGQKKILAWHVASSDAAVFNRLLASPVEIGTGQAQALFPAQLR